MSVFVTLDDSHKHVSEALSGWLCGGTQGGERGGGGGWIHQPHTGEKKVLKLDSCSLETRRNMIEYS